MVYYNFNQHQQEGYAANLSYDNFKNNSDIILTGIRNERNHINFNYIYNNINNRMQNLIL